VTDDRDGQPRGLSLAKVVVRGALLVGGLQVSIKVLGFFEKVILGNVYGTDSPSYAAYLVAFEVLLVCSEVLKLSVIPSLVPVLEGVLAHGHAGGADLSRTRSPKAAPPAPVRRPLRGVRRRGGDRSAERLTGRFATLIVLFVLAVVTVPALIFAGPILRATFARDWLADPARRDYVGLMIIFVRVMLSGVIFTGAGVCTYALLNSYRRFGIAALGDVAFKLLGLGSFVFVGFVLGLRQQAIFGLVGGVFAGCIGYVAVHLIGLRRMGRLRGVRPGLALRDPDLRQTLILFAPLFLSVLLFNSRRLFDKLLAAQMELADYVAAQDFGFRFVETPYRFLIEPFAIVLLPYMAGLAASGDRAAFRRSAMASLRALLLVFVPASVGLYLLREPFIQVLLEHGRFDVVSTYLTCGALRWYVVALTLWGLDIFIQRMYFAARDTLRPTVFEVAGMALYLALAFAWRGSLRHEGLALAFALSRVLKVSLLVAFLRAKLGGLEARRNLVFLGRLFVAVAVLGGAVYGIARVLDTPREVQVWIEAEGERFAYRSADGSRRNGRAIAAEQGRPDVVRLAADADRAGHLHLVVPETDTYRLWLRARMVSSEPAAAVVSLNGRRLAAGPSRRMTWRHLADDLTLTAGLHELEVEAVNGAVDVDGLLLANSAGSLATLSPQTAARPEIGTRGVRAIGVSGARGRRLMALLLGTVVGLILYLLVLRLLRVEELTTVLRLLRRRPPGA